MHYGAMNFPIKPLLNDIREIAALGVDYLELSMDAPQAHYTIVRKVGNEIRRILDARSMGLLGHLPCFVYLADLTDSIRQASLNEVLHSLEVAAELDIKKVVLHPGLINGLGIFVEDTALSYAMRSLDTIVTTADSLGIHLCLENMFPKYPSFFEPDHFSKIFDQYPNLSLALDIGHANIDCQDGRRVLNFISQFGARISHLHVSDNHGKKDDHFAIGEGNIRFAEVVDALKQSGYNDTVTLEVFSENRKKLKSSQEQFAAMYADIQAGAS
jgi:sugar phosphate isomerase/epimerase